MFLNLSKRYLHTYKNFSKATWINILAVFIMSFGLMMSSIFTLFLNQKGVSIREIAWIIATGGVGGILGSYLCGSIAKRVSPTRIAQLSVLAFAILMLIYPLIKNMSLFFILLFLANFFLGLFRPANNLMLFAHAPAAEHTRVMALNRVAFNLGLAFATSIGAFLAAINFNWFFIFSAVMALLAAIVLFAYNALLHVDINQDINAKEKLNTTNSWRMFLRQHSFIFLSLLFFCFYLMFNQTRITYSLFLTDDYHLNLRHIGLLFMINFLLVVFFEVPLMTRLRHANQISLTLWGSVFVGLGMFMLPFGHGLSWAAWSVLLWSIGEVLATSPFFVLAYRFAAPDNKAFYVGIFHSVFSASLVLAPLAGGFLYPIYHGYLLWISCGIMTVMIVLGFLYLKRQQAKVDYAN